MPFQDAFAGAVPGFVGGLQAGQQIFGGMAARREQAARQQQILKLSIMEREGNLYEAAGKALELPPSQRKTYLGLIDDQLKQLQQFSGKEPVGLGTPFFEMAAKADEEQAPLFRAILDGTVSDYLKGNPSALLTFKDPVSLMGKIAEFRQKMESADTQKAIRDYIGPGFDSHAAAVKGNENATGMPAAMGEGPGRGAIGGAFDLQPPMQSEGPAFTGPEGFRSAAMGGPHVASGESAPRYTRSINTGPNGSSLTLTERLPNLGISTEDEPLPGGGTQRFRVTNDPTRGVVGRTPVGAPIMPQDQRDREGLATTLGYEPGTPEHKAVSERLRVLPQLDPGARGEFLRSLDRRGGGSIGGAIDTAESRATSRKVNEARQIKAATEAEDPLSGETQGIVGPQSAAINGLDRLLKNYKPDEINAFAGRFNKMREQGKAVVAGAKQAVGLGEGKINERFQAFKADVASVRQVIQNAITGKTMTPFEGESIAAMIPTGEESSPAEFRVKLGKALQMLQISRETRLELARQGKGGIDLEALDARLKQKFASLDAIPGGGGTGTADPIDAVRQELQRRR